MFYALESVACEKSHASHMTSLNENLDKIDSLVQVKRGNQQNKLFRRVISNLVIIRRYLAVYPS